MDKFELAGILITDKEREVVGRVVARLATEHGCFITHVEVAKSLRCPKCKTLYVKSLKEAESGRD